MENIQNFYSIKEEKRKKKTNNSESPQNNFKAGEKPQVILEHMVLR